jgi:hypothetical protein
MSRINSARVVLAGLAAGVVANGLDFVIGMILQDDQIAQAQRLGLDPAALEASVPVWIVVNFIYGLLLAFTYAAIRPRFGPGPKTAVIAGVVLFLTVTSILTGFMAMGMFMQDVFMKSAALQLISTLAASLTAGAVYRE